MGRLNEWKGEIKNIKWGNSNRKEEKWRMEKEGYPNGACFKKNASNLSSYKRRLERLVGILKFQELLKMYPVPVKVVKNENGFHITDCV
ncbi:hypothetical protein TNCV_2073741 [Trichonephila clavipes]|nr:hypothetical protein TNCV_2073741 [Trichonephila clavipes]